MIQGIQNGNKYLLRFPSTVSRSSFKPHRLPTDGVRHDQHAAPGVNIKRLVHGPGSGYICIVGSMCKHKIIPRAKCLLDSKRTRTQGHLECAEREKRRPFEHCWLRNYTSASSCAGGAAVEITAPKQNVWTSWKMSTRQVLSPGCSPSPSSTLRYQKMPRRGTTQCTLLLCCSVSIFSLLTMVIDSLWKPSCRIRLTLWLTWI